MVVPTRSRPLVLGGPELPSGVGGAAEQADEVEDLHQAEEAAAEEQAEDPTDRGWNTGQAELALARAYSNTVSKEFST